MSNDFRRLDESPRQIFCGVMLWMSLVGITWCLNYYPRTGNDNDSYELAPTPGASLRSAAGGTLLVVITYTFLNARDGTMRRPHPGVWRILHGCNLWYAMMATILLVVRHDDGVAVMESLFPGVERTERGPMEGVGANLVAVGAPGSAADDDDGSVGAGRLGMDHLDCSLTMKNIKRQVFGLWFFAHCVGWWAKMLMLRDLWTCLVYSTVFELVELTLQCLVPEFQECWWDSVVLDWLVANLCIGMMLGMLTRRLLNWPALNWTRDRRPWLWKNKLVVLITPSSWREYNWNPENDPVSLLLSSVIWIAMAVGEVNSFFLINIFQLPRDHAFNILRQVFFCFTALPACEEWYEYTRHVRVHTTGVTTKEYTAKYLGRKPRIGQSVWLLAVTVSLETAAIVRYSLALGLFSQAQYFGVAYWGPWAASATLFLSYLVIHCWFFYREAHRYPKWLGLLKWSSFLPLILLCRLYAF